MTPRRSIILLAAALALFPAACQSGRDLSNPFREGGRARGSEDVTFFVTNLAFADATLYTIAGGARRRLGRVTGKQEATLTMSLGYPMDLQVEIDLLAGPTCYTSLIPVNPGDDLELIIQIDGPNIRCNGYSPGSS